jgi:hypothetical protein
VRELRQISNRRNQDKEGDYQPVRCASVRCKSGSYVRPNPARENPACKEKQESSSRQGGDSQSHAFRIVRVSSRWKGPDITSHRIHQDYHEQSSEDTGQ